MKKGRLSVSWGYSKDEDVEDIYFTNGPGVSESDAQLLHYFFDCIKGANKMTLMEELKSRGYDLKTFKLVVQKG